MSDHQSTRPAATLLTIADASELLRVSRSTIYELIKRGELVPIRISERIRFRREDIDGYVGARARGASPMNATSRAKPGPHATTSTVAAAATRLDALRDVMSRTQRALEALQDGDFPLVEQLLDDLVDDIWRRIETFEG
jgi:excisionase family DNA binding protein